MASEQMCAVCRKVRFRPLIDIQTCCSALCAKKGGRVEELTILRAYMEQKLHKAQVEGKT